MKHALKVLALVVWASALPAQTFYQGVSGYGLLNYIPFENSTNFDPDPNLAYNGFELVAIHGSPTLVSGLPGLGQAAYFDGEDDYLVYSPLVDELFSDWTVTFFFQIDSYTGQQYEGPWHQSDVSGSSSRTLLFHSRTDAGLYGPYANHSGGTSNLRQTNQITANVWHHAAITYAFDVGLNTGTLSYYLDGVLIASGNTANVEVGNPFRFEVGRSVGYSGTTPSYGYFNGWIDEIGIFRGALSACEIRAIASPLFLTSYIPFENNTFEELVTGNPETVVNSPSFIAGVLGDAVRFDNSSQQYIHYANPLIPNTLGAFSLSFWMRVFSTTASANGPYHQSELSSVTPATFLYHTFGTNYRGPYVKYTNGSSWCSLYTNTSYDPDEWHLVSVVYDGSDLRHYLNGTNITTTACTTLAPGNSFPFELGRSITYVWSGSTYNANFSCFDGVIDEVRVYSQAYDDCFWEALYYQWNGLTKQANATREPQATHTVRVYPNPSSGQLTLSMHYGSEVNILNSTGQVVRNYGRLEAGMHLLRLEELPQGVYLLQTETESTRLVLLD
jgi:hypothetical protein